LVTVENKKSEDDDVIIPQIPTTSYQHDWNTWSPGALRHPISSNLQTGKAKTKYNSQLIQKRRNHNNSLNLNKKNEVYEQQLDLVKMESERTAMRFEWDKIEHELRVKALELDIEIKKKTLLNLDKNEF